LLTRKQITNRQTDRQRHTDRDNITSTYTLIDTYIHTCLIVVVYTSSSGVGFVNAADNNVC